MLFAINFLFCIGSPFLHYTAISVLPFKIQLFLDNKLSIIGKCLIIKGILLFLIEVMIQVYEKQKIFSLIITLIGYKRQALSGNKDRLK